MSRVKRSVWTQGVQKPDDAYIRKILFLSGFLDLFGVSMVMPLIQPQAKELGASHTLAGILGSVYGGLQLVSSPIYGQWSDQVNRQMSLYVCLILAGCSYFVLGIYSSLLVFFIGRIVAGFFKHSQTVTKAYLADMIEKDKQADVQGTFNSFSSIGFILGPMVGGHLAESPWGFSLVAILSGMVFVLNAVLIWWYLPPDEVQQHKEITIENSLTRSDTSTSLKKLGSDEISFSPKEFLKSVREFDWPELWDLMLVKFFAGFAMIIYRTNFPMALKEKFSASPTTIGYMTSYNGIVATLFGFVMGPIIKKFSSTAICMRSMCVLQVLSFLCLTQAPSMWTTLVFLTPLNIVATVLRVSATGLTIERSGTRALGSVMGFSQSVVSIARMLAPFIAGVALEFSPDGASLISVIASFIGALVMFVREQDPVLRKKKIL